MRGLFGTVHHRDQQGLRADVEVLLDQGHVGLHRAHDGVGLGVRRDGAQLVERGARVVGRVFAVDQQPVEAAAGQGLGHVGRGEADPAADLGLAGLEGVAEGVLGDLHCGVFVGSG